MSIELDGIWEKGIAFDVHTLSSTYIGPDEFGHDRWDTTRSEMGELLYRLKYSGDRTCLDSIVALLNKIKGIDQFDCIIPIPPTDQSRKFQPVTEITQAIGRRHGIDVRTDVLLKKAGGPQLKNVEDRDKRTELLRQLLYLDDSQTVAGQKVLLVDDLFRSGATLSVATELLYQEGKAKKVCVLTMTKTRSIR